jgi:hypothetical protein
MPASSAWNLDACVNHVAVCFVGHGMLCYCTSVMPCLRENVLTHSLAPSGTDRNCTCAQCHVSSSQLLIAPSVRRVRRRCARRLRPLPKDTKARASWHDAAAPNANTQPDATSWHAPPTVVAFLQWHLPRHRVVDPANCSSPCDQGATGAV